jgi:ribokinase
MRNGLLVYGDIGIDIHINTIFKPKIGQDAIVDKIIFEPGGSAANCAAVAAHLGIPTIFLGFIGGDNFGKIVKFDLNKFGVNTKSIKTISGDTGITVAIIEPNGERTFYSYRGVNSNGEFHKIPDSVFVNCKFLHVSGYSFQSPNSLYNATYLINKAKKEGVLLSLDPSYWYSREFFKNHPGLLSDVNIIFPNREEAKLLSGSDDPAEASRILLDQGPKIVIIKLGPEGCYVASEQHSYYLPAISISKVIDTTGAGDAFCGGFLFGQTIGLDIKESATIGNIASSLVISHVGGHIGTPTLDEIVKILSDSDQSSLAKKIQILKESALNPL